MNIDNQIAVVTGGSSGLGRSCVEALRAKGLKVMIWDIHNPTVDNYFVFCDVSSETEVNEALNITIAKLGTPRIVINCAGIAPAKRMVSKEGAMPLSDFRAVININLIGTFNVMRVTAAAMSELSLEGEERGVIINTASIAAYEGQIGQTAYSASKGGVIALTLPAARELASLSIRVNSIAPGLMATPLLLNMSEETQEKLAATVTFPKRFGTGNEFAALVLHIIENSFINGETIRLDGALRMQAR